MRVYYIIAIMLMTLVSCHSDELLTEDNEQNVEADVRPLVHHEVSISIDGPETRVAYNKSGDGLLLSWEASETLGVYIKDGDNYTYAGTVTSAGSNGDRGTREFSGTVSLKNAGEQYVYVHPAPTGETQGNNAKGVITLSSQTGTIGSTTHLKTYIPLVWQEGSPFVTNHGYVVHLTLSFREDPGTISSVTLQTMDGVGTTEIFPTSFVAATMSASNTKTTSVTLNVTNSTLQRNSNATWIADVYLVSSYPSDDIDVFRTKYNVKVEASNGTFYNEYCSFPAQESADANTGLKMLANGKCYNLETAMSKGAATTVINSQYKVNSLMGMWNEYGKTKDPFGQKKADANVPTQLKINILDKRSDFTARTLEGKSSQGSPTFTWNMVTNQVEGNSDKYKQKDVTYNNIDIVGEPTEVYVTFISEYAWSQNLLGYYHYDSDKVPASSNDVLKTIIFPNVSKGGHVPYNKDGIDGGPNINPNTANTNVGKAGDAPLTEYTTVQLLYNYPDGTVSTLFPVGTTIGFFIMRDPKASSSGSDLDTEHQGQEGSIDHTGYQPRQDNTLLDWNSWRLFTNTAWNGASGNTGWWDSNCWNFFCSADVGDRDNGGVIPGLALYGAKDDASHNYNYSFSAMLYMVSTSNPASMQTHNKAYFNIGTGDQVIAKQ